MKYEVTDKGIIVTDLSQFDVRQIAECGQIFRYRYEQTQNNSLRCRFFSKDKTAEVNQFADYAEILTDDVTYFENYFDLERDYGEIKKNIASVEREDSPMTEALRYGGGIRILKQDLDEMFFSFIISANNNIKRIQGIIERLCEACGERKEWGYAFPTVKTLAEKSEKFFAEIGCGYRARYLSESAKMWAETDVQAMSELKTAELRKELLRFLGIGGKVADCILLFGFGRKDVFPTDTWIKKAYHDFFEEGHNDKDIPKVLTMRYGEYAGYAQQYMFFFRRENI